MFSQSGLAMVEREFVATLGQLSLGTEDHWRSMQRVNGGQFQGCLLECYSSDSSVWSRRRKARGPALGSVGVVYLRRKWLDRQATCPVWLAGRPGFDHHQPTFERQG